MCVFTVYSKQYEFDEVRWGPRNKRKGTEREGGREREKEREEERQRERERETKRKRDKEREKDRQRKSVHLPSPLESILFGLDRQWSLRLWYFTTSVEKQSRN